MSFREKSALISFVLLLTLLIAYAGPLVYIHVAGGNLPADPFHYVLALLLVFGVLQAVLHAAIRMHSPHDARTPKDERERLIELKAARVGFYALIAGELLVLAAQHVRLHVGVLMNGVMLVVLLAWLVKLGSEIAFYRRGS